MIRILAHQCASGAFPSQAGDLVDQTCFVSATVALLLDPRHHRAALDRALDFVERCEAQDKPGLFAFYPAGEDTPRVVDHLPPDADDTALAWLALLHGSRRSPDQARRAFRRWIGPAACRLSPGDAAPWVRPGAVRTWLHARGTDNPIDLAVNANVLAWATRIGLAGHPAARGARASLLAAARGGYCPRLFARRLAPFYADISELYIATERAIAVGNDGLEPVLAWLAPVFSSAALRDDKPLYCNAHGLPVWRSGALQQARKELLSARRPTAEPISRTLS